MSDTIYPSPIDHPDFTSWINDQPRSLDSPNWNIWNNQTNANNATTNANYSYDGQYPYNRNYRYFGYSGGDRYNELFSKSSIQFMSKMITNKLNGIHPQGKKIIVPDETIISVADSVFTTAFANADQMQKMIVNFIVNKIKVEYDTLNYNNSLSVWVLKYDEDSGMKKFDGIKLNNKRRQYHNVWKY